MAARLLLFGPKFFVWQEGPITQRLLLEKGVCFMEEKETHE